MFYDVAGFINTLFVLLGLTGVWAQVSKIGRRRRMGSSGEAATAVLSLNQFSVSFLAYFSFFVYGYSVEPFNHYMVWPRLFAALLVARILYEIWHDRRSRPSAASFGGACVALACGLAGLAWGERYVDQGRVASAALIVVVTLLLAQGYAHQILLIWRCGRTGAVSLRMSQRILLMDISTFVFAVAMGPEAGWPLMLLATVSGTTKLAIMWLFRWERTSPAALGKRSAAVPVAAA